MKFTQQQMEAFLADLSKEYGVKFELEDGVKDGCFSISTNIKEDTDLTAYKGTPAHDDFSGSEEKFWEAYYQSDDYYPEIRPLFAEVAQAYNSDAKRRVDRAFRQVASWDDGAGIRAGAQAYTSFLRRCIEYSRKYNMHTEEEISKVEKDIERVFGNGEE